jgi:D-alanine--poly(phosphoribitol) ligase subunit 2
MEDEIINIIEEVSEYKNLRDNIEIDLLENNILDSLAFINLLTELEDKFDIEIQPTQVEPNTWRKVSSIVNLVMKMKQ